MLKKKPFERSIVKYNTRDDLGMEIDHTFHMWRDPSSKVVFSLLDTISTTEDKLNKMPKEDKDKLNDEFWWCASQVFIDCDIEGLDFSTPEKSKESFDSPYISWGILFDVLLRFITDLIQSNEKLKNVLALLGNRTNSGQNSRAKTENE